MFMTRLPSFATILLIGACSTRYQADPARLDADATKDATAEVSVDYQNLSDAPVDGSPDHRSCVPEDNEAFCLQEGTQCSVTQGEWKGSWHRAHCGYCPSSQGLACSEAGRCEAASSSATPLLADIPYKVPACGPEAATQLDLYRAASSTPTPTFVYLHGGGWSSGTKNDPPDDFVLTLLEVGISVVRLEYQKSFTASYPQQLLDLDCALRWIASRADDLVLDPQRVMIGGYSAGAHLVLEYALDRADYRDPSCPHPPSAISIRKVVAIAGPTNFDTWTDLEELRDAHPDDPHSDYTWMKHAFIASKDYAAVSPLWSVDASASDDILATSFLLLYCKQDNLVSFTTQAEPFYQRLLDAGFFAQARWYTCDDHSFAHQQAQRRYDVIADMATFLGN